MKNFSDLITDDMEEVSWDVWSDRVQELNKKHLNNVPYNFPCVSEEEYTIYNDFNGNFFSLNVYTDMRPLYYMKKNYKCP